MLNMYILKIFQDKTDFHHRLLQQDIIDLLEKEYAMKCERKAVARNISCLREMGYEIVNDHGYYLAERTFDDSELRLLIDSLLFARQIPQHQRKNLINKIAGLSNEFFRSRTSHILGATTKGPENKQLFYTIEVLDEAISKHKQVRFTYNSYGIDKKLHPRRKEPYLVNPYQMVAAGGRYYLICNYDKHDGIANYRLDRITDIELLYHPAKSVHSLEKSFNLPQHMAEHIYMFSGPSARVQFLVDQNYIGDVLDWFADCTLQEHDRTRCLATVTVNKNAMLYWTLQYGLHVEILSPKDLREQVKQAAEAIAKKYK